MWLIVPTDEEEMLSLILVPTGDAAFNKTRDCHRSA
jgi:hypothetical protein